MAAARAAAASCVPSTASTSRSASGEIVALVGESGSGKTTTGRALVRLAPITEGQVLLDGQDVTAIGGRALRDYRRRVQIIFQDPYESLDPRRTIGDQVARAARGPGHRAPRAERAERVDRALEDAGLRPARVRRDRFPHELSGGQRQRVAIACAMVLEPDVLVADEPVSMLDVSLRSGILRVMLDLRERARRRASCSSPTTCRWRGSSPTASRSCTSGRIVEIGPAEQLVSDPRHPYTRALLSVMPSPDPRARRAAADPARRDARRVADPDRMPLPHPVPARLRPMSRGGSAGLPGGRGPHRRVLAGRARRAAAGVPVAGRVAAVRPTCCRGRRSDGRRRRTALIGSVRGASSHGRVDRGMMSA